MAGRILVATDELGRSAYSLLRRDPFFTRYSLRIEHYVGAKLNNIIDVIEILTTTFDKDDFVIIFGGKNDCRAFKEINKVRLENVVRKLNCTNTIIIAMPLWLNRPDINQFVDLNNYYVRQICTNNPAAHFMDINKLFHTKLENFVQMTKIRHKKIFGKIMNDLALLVLEITLDNRIAANANL